MNRILLFVFIVFIYSCEKEKINENNGSEITINSVEISGFSKLINNGKFLISAKGGIQPYTFSIDSGKTFSSTDSFTGLYGGTYTIAIKDAENTIAYGNTYTLHSYPKGNYETKTIIDERDGQHYRTVKIGKHWWMQQNLNYGKLIKAPASTADIGQTNNNLVEKYAYNNDEKNLELYGGLYTWNEAMNYTVEDSVQGVCPSGWHIPSDAEWKELETSLGMPVYETNYITFKDGIEVNPGRGLKYSSKLLLEGSSGFNCLGSGGWSPDRTGGFYNLWYGAFLTSTVIDSQVIVRAIENSGRDQRIHRNFSKKQNAHAIRCVQD